MGRDALFAVHDTVAYGCWLQGWGGGAFKGGAGHVTPHPPKCLLETLSTRRAVQLKTIHATPCLYSPPSIAGFLFIFSDIHYWQMTQSVIPCTFRPWRPSLCFTHLPPKRGPFVVSHAAQRVQCNFSFWDTFWLPMRLGCSPTSSPKDHYKQSTVVLVVSMFLTRVSDLSSVGVAVKSDINQRAGPKFGVCLSECSSRINCTCNPPPSLLCFPTRTMRHTDPAPRFLLSLLCFVAVGMAF